MQDNVDITTREDSLNVKYGMINFGVERDLARTSVKYIYTDLCDIRKNFIRLGFHLDEFERNEYYKDFGYASIAEFADVNLGMDKSAVSRYINVFRFCAATQEGGSKRLMYIDDKYKDYSFSQLSEMVSMPLDKVSKVKPDMSIKQIRELKKAGKAVATSQPEKPDNLFDISTYEK